MLEPGKEWNCPAVVIDDRESKKTWPRSEKSFLLYLPDTQCTVGAKNVPTICLVPV